jgi:hypothetical protein
MINWFRRRVLGLSPSRAYTEAVAGAFDRGYTMSLEQMRDDLRELHDRDKIRIGYLIALIMTTPDLEIHATDGRLIRGIAVDRQALMDVLQVSGPEIQSTRGVMRWITHGPVNFFPEPIVITESQEEMRTLVGHTDARVIEHVSDWLRFRATDYSDYDENRRDWYARRALNDAADLLDAGAPWNDELWREHRKAQSWRNFTKGFRS